MGSKFSSASIKKGKRSALGSYDQEQTRTMGRGQSEWQNRNIDTCETHAIDVVFNLHGGSVKDAVLARIAQGTPTGRKIRKDAVTHLCGYATMPDYSRRTPEERREFERLVVDFFAEACGGRENIVDVRWHFDESAPHLHVTGVPLTPDGRLCCKEVFKPTKASMSKWQRDYYAAVAQPMGYDAPDFGKSGEKGYTKATQATREQLEKVQSDLADAEARLECLQGAVAITEREVGEVERRAGVLERAVNALKSAFWGALEALKTTMGVELGLVEAKDPGRRFWASQSLGRGRCVTRGAPAPYLDPFERAMVGARAQKVDGRSRGWQLSR